jgi:hypothetical protein
LSASQTAAETGPFDAEDEVEEGGENYGDETIESMPLVRNYQVSALDAGGLSSGSSTK